MSTIFVSYRRRDSAAIVGRLIDRLEVRFGKERIFRDLDSIDYGLIPVLVGNAVMPSEIELPENLKPLAQRNAAQVRDDPDFNGDVERLCESIRKQLKGLGNEIVKAVTSEIRRLPVSEANGAKLVQREPTDKDLVEYLNDVKREAKTLADIWQQLHKELVEAAVYDEEKWKRFVVEVSASRRNARPFVYLRSFAEAAQRAGAVYDSRAMPALILHTENIVNAREKARGIIDALQPNGDSSGNEKQTAEKKQATQKQGLRELGAIIESMYRDAAELEILAIAVEKQFSADQYPPASLDPPLASIRADPD